MFCLSRFKDACMAMGRWPSRCAAALGLFACVLLPVHATAPDQAPVEADCAPLLDRSLFDTPHQDREGIRRVQHCLVKKQFPPGKIDGRLGPETRGALEAYWRSQEGHGTEQTPRADGLGVSYILTAEDLKGLRVGDGVLARVKPLKGRTFESQEDFVAALEGAIKARAGELEPFLNAVMAHAEVKPTIQLKAEDFKQLRIRDMPPELLARLADIQDLPFPDRAAMNRAIDSRLGLDKDTAQAADCASEPSSAICRAPAIKAQAREVNTFQVTDATLRALADSPAFGKDIPALIEGATQLQGIDFPTRALFRKALETQATALQPGAVMDPTALETIAHQARKVHEFDPAAAVVWRDNACGCVLEDLSGTVYGFYPYWRAGTTQSVDFSVLSRVGYYGVRLDDGGNLASSHHWRPDRAQFINEARRHGTRVDLVVHRNEWSGWRQDIQARDFSSIDLLTDKIVKAVATPLGNTFFNRHQALFSAGASSTPRMGDGVTLFFEDYPTDEASSLYLARFIQELKKKLRQVDQGLFLNVMVPQEVLGTGIFTLKYLSHLVPEMAHFETGFDAHDDVDLFLVLLNKPTSANKKALRKIVEEMFSGPNLHLGMQRRNMLRKIVPVIMPDGRDPVQFTNDLIYFEDNFGGIGFWPMPVLTGGEAGKQTPAANRVAEMVAGGLHKDYLWDFAQKPNALAKFVCVHKWGFRLAFDALAILLGTFAVLAVFDCRVRRFWEKYTWYVMAVGVAWLALALAILFYDPFYTDIARGNGPLILVIVANLAYVAWVLIHRKRRGQQP